MLSISVKIASDRYFAHAGVFVCGELYCKQNIPYVPGAVRKKAEMTSIVEELVGNQKIVQAFSYEERANERFGKVNESFVSVESRLFSFPLSQIRPPAL